MNIVLTGFMGTGKSAVSRMLSKKLDWQLIDTDSMIEKDTGMKISDIFEKKGESHFRNLETKAVQLVSLSDKAVISCGGGVVLREENMKALETGGFVVCLTASPETIYNRIKSNKDRPLLNVADPTAQIKELLDARQKFYDRCHLLIDTSVLTIEQIVEKILSDNRVCLS